MKDSWSETRNEEIRSSTHIGMSMRGDRSEQIVMEEDIRRDNGYGREGKGSKVDMGCTCEYRRDQRGCQRHGMKRSGD